MNINISKIRFFSVIILFSIAFLFSCKKETEENPVPNKYVNFTLYLNDPEFQDLKIPGNYIFVHQGTNEIVIYRLSMDDFVAYDRVCTYEADPNCLVYADSSGATLECSCCKSKFLLIDGTVNSGLARHSLRQYYVTYDGGDYIHVSN